MSSFSWKRRKVLGKGSYGTVFLASTDSPSLPLIAVKSVVVSFADSLMNESKVLSSLGGCPEIIRSFGSNETDDGCLEIGKKCFNLLLEYASEGTLTDVICNRSGHLTEAETGRYTRMILKGLLHIHAKGFVHCDLKPANILAFPDGALKIADFGLSNSVCYTDRFKGTLLYTSPESLRVGQIGSALDIWSLGCIVVEMLTGMPWDNSSTASLVQKLKLLKAIPKIPEGISDCGKDFLNKCFASNPRERWTAKMLLHHKFITGIGCVRRTPCFLPPHKINFSSYKPARPNISNSIS